MKSYQIPHIGIGAIVCLWSVCSCDAKVDSRENRAVDSVESERPVAQGVRSPWSDSLNSANGVKVDLKYPESFDWAAFRQKFHQSTDSSDEFPAELAVGPWVSWNEYEYRRVYRYDNDALWIQTFYRPKDSLDSSNSDAVVLLDSQDPKYMQMGPLWADMLTRGHYLSDSLR